MFAVVGVAVVEDWVPKPSKLLFFSLEEFHEGLWDRHWC